MPDNGALADDGSEQYQEVIARLTKERDELRGKVRDAIFNYDELDFIGVVFATILSYEPRKLVFRQFSLEKIEGLLNKIAGHHRQESEAGE